MIETQFDASTDMTTQGLCLAPIHIVSHSFQSSDSIEEYISPTRMIVR